jgi:hypothetical protein
MNVRVDEGRKDMEPFRVERLDLPAGLDPAGGGDRLDHSRSHEQVVWTAETRAGVEQLRRAEQEVRRVGRAHREPRTRSGTGFAQSVHAGCFSVGPGDSSREPFSPPLAERSS